MAKTYASPRAQWYASLAGWSRFGFLGFLGCLGFLGFLPGCERLWGFSGLSGLFAFFGLAGLYDIARRIEVAYHYGAVRGQAGR